MATRYGWLSLVAAGTLACQERIAAPGACPEYCPSTAIEVVDSLLVGSVVQDEYFRGYVSAHEASAMQLVSQGTPEETRGVIRFFRFSESVFDTSLSLSRPITSVDSFRVEVTVRRRIQGVTGMTLAVHRLPATVDSLATFTSLVPYFADSTVMATVPVPDTLTSDTLKVAFAAAAFPTFEDDSLQAAVGLVLRSAAGGFLDLGSIDGGFAARMRRFVQVAAADSTEGLSDEQQAAFDTYLFTSPPDPDPAALVVGGVPSARALLRINLPPGIADSAEIVRATLILIPDEPVLGAPGDTFRLRAEVLATDIGPKSPVLTPPDSLGFASTRVPVGTSDSVFLDITRIVRPWRTTPEAPRAFMLAVASEAAGLGEIHIRSTRSGAGAPNLRVTYVPLLLRVSR